MSLALPCRVVHVIYLSIKDSKCLLVMPVLEIVLQDLAEVKQDTSGLQMVTNMVANATKNIICLPHFYSWESKEITDFYFIWEPCHKPYI